MNQQEIDLYVSLSKTKIYGERFGLLKPNDLATFPPVFDPEHPGRCLWGMVDWERWCLISYSRGTVDIHDNTIIFEDRLDLALIKAILKEGGKP